MALIALVGVTFAFVTPLMLVVIVEIVAALVFRPAASGPTKNRPIAVTILIPAHNEQQSIGGTLASLLADLQPGFRLLVVAHNCTDDTVKICRRMGAEVMEVCTEAGGGKPYALKAGLKALDENPPDVVVVVDADCVVQRGSVKSLAEKAFYMNRPAMSAYFFAAPEGTLGIAALSSLATLLKNYVRPLGLHALGLPCLLNGSGSAYPFRAIRLTSHGEGSIAEDYQLAIDLLRQGYPTVFVPEARIDSQLPKTKGKALAQRRRWEHGHLFLAFCVAPALLLEGLRELDLDKIGIAFEVAVPPLAFLGLMWAIGLALAVGLVAHGGSSAPLWIILIFGIAFTTSLVAASLRFAGVRETVCALASLPGYLFWKFPLYVRFFTKRETRWIKTGRD